MSAKNKIKIGDIVVYKHYNPNGDSNYGYVQDIKPNRMYKVFWFNLQTTSSHFKSQLIKVS